MMRSELLQAIVLRVSTVIATRHLRRMEGEGVFFAPGTGLRDKEAWLFFRQWLARPLSTAAFSPSSRFLNRCMVQALPAGTRRVIELGAGTGALTHALLAHGIEPGDLLALEFNPSLHRYLAMRFPDLTVVRGDARGLDRLPEAAAFARRAPVQAVLSGLGLLSMSRDAQAAVLSAAFDLMHEGGVFVQFTYGPAAPIARQVMHGLDLRARRHGFTLRNLPPASVYVFTRRGDAALAARHALPRNVAARRWRLP